MIDEEGFDWMALAELRQLAVAIENAPLEVMIEIVAWNEAIDAEVADRERKAREREAKVVDLAAARAARESLPPAG